MRCGMEQRVPENAICLEAELKLDMSALMGARKNVPESGTEGVQYEQQDHRR